MPNINKFLTSITNHGYLDNNAFKVLIQPPPILRNASLSNQGDAVSIKRITEDLSFRIDQVRAPGINLTTADVYRYGIGTSQKQPFTAQFQEVNISLLGDHYGEFWQFWYLWTRSIFEYNGTSGGSAPSYTVEYKDQYSSTVIIFIYDHYGNIIQKINLFEAYPVSLREVPLSWGDPNLMKINVSLMYTEYTIEGSELKSKNETQTTNLNSAAAKETITF